MALPQPRPLALYGGRDPRHIPIYSYAEAARLAHVPQATLRAWVVGRSHNAGGRSSAPVIRRPDDAIALVSFTNVVEAHVLSCIRVIHNVALERVRAAIDYTEKQMGVEHPLASGRFMTDGVDLFVDELESLVNVSKSGQLAIRECIERLLKRIEVDELQFARRLYPITRPSGSEQGGPTSIMVDPMVAFGRPVITNTRVPIEVLWQRFDGGESLDDLAKDYEIEVSKVEEAIRFYHRAAA